MSKPRESCDGCDSDDYDIHTCGKTVRRRAEVEPGQKALELLQRWIDWMVKGQTQAKFNDIVNEARALLKELP